MPIERPSLPAVDAWYARIAARPAFKAHIEMPFGTCLEEWLHHEKAVH